MPDAAHFPTGNCWKETGSFIDKAGDYWIKWTWTGPDQTVPPYYKRGETVYDCHPQQRQQP